MTKIYHLTTVERAAINQAAQAITEGGTVVFPTETVYGIGANGFDGDAVRKIFRAKGRPSDNPLILHIASRSQLRMLVRAIPADAEKLIKAFWPGPLTLIFKKSAVVPDVVTAGLATVAVRMPSHPIARALITAADLPIAAPSANLSGKPSATMGEHVERTFDNLVDVILTGGRSQIGLESTVVSVLDHPPTILRPGSVTIEQLRYYLPTIVLDPALVEHQSVAIARAPGMKYRHYAPRAALFIIEQTTPHVKLQRLAALMSAHQLKVRTIEKDAVWLAKNLYAALIECDVQQVDVILVREVTAEGVGLAVMNRLNKAAENKRLTL